METREQWFKWCGSGTTVCHPTHPYFWFQCSREHLNREVLLIGGKDPGFSVGTSTRIP